MTALPPVDIKYVTARVAPKIFKSFGLVGAGLAPARLGWFYASPFILGDRKSRLYTYKKIPIS